MKRGYSWAVGKKTGGLVIVAPIIRPGAPP